MKNKSRIFALILSACMAFTFFAGCSDTNQPPNDGTNPPDTGTTNPPDTGKTDPPVVEPEVPDEEAPAFEEADATLSLTGSIDKISYEGSVSSDLFGLFLEDINYASQALDDNLIANGNFEGTTASGGKSYGWKEGNNLSFTIASSEPLHVNTPNYASINTPAGGTLTNSGYEVVPMNITSGRSYLFSAFIRDYTGEITVRAKNGGNIYAEKSFSVTAPADEWVKVQQTVTATATGREKVVVEISFAEADSKVLLDGVQFEALEATAGIKNYMYRAIANLSPAFFRFPGGCVIEGTNAQGTDAFDWKNSIGAVKVDGDDTLPAFTYTLYKDGVESEETTYGEWATRTPNTNIWQKRFNDYYDHEYGLGFYEYFLLCDTLGAKAIPIVSCGMACQTQGSGTAMLGRHGNRIADYIQDAIDLIEFAKGGTDTEWGHIRELMGHPEPFEMDYIGIGNEQWDQYYTQYYEKFLSNAAFKKALNDYNVKPIVGNCTLFQHCENPERNSDGAALTAMKNAKAAGTISKNADYGVVDQHYYVNYTDFLANTHLYDNYKRPTQNPNDYYEVFVGEYAVNSDSVRAPMAYDNIVYKQTQNSWLTALSEAAMMTGFERNGDIVKLAAYAPMFGTSSASNRQWPVDMMYFTNERVTLTPNYYVQQLFMQNTGDYKVAANLSYAAGTAKPQTTYKATSGSGAEATRVLDDIFYVASADEETGDVIVKIINAGKTTLKVNVDFGLDLTLTGIADVVELIGKSPDDTNERSEVIRPKKHTIGITESVLGYTVQPYSVTAIRLRTK